MKNQEPVFPDRREFLRGAAALGVAAALGWEAERPATAGLTPPQAALAFWDGSRFQDPAQMATDPAFGHAGEARIRIHGHSVPTGSGASALHVVKAHYAVEIAGRATHAPFYAWVAAKNVPGASPFRMPVLPGKGLLLSSERRGSPSEEQFHLLGTDPNQAEPKLRAGTYVLAPGTPDWRLCRLSEEGGKPALCQRTLRGLAPVGFEHLLLTICPA